jgi:3-hydroxybutyryl-CoA dehydrogenase
MGRGIAQLACAMGARTLVVDARLEVAEQAVAAIDGVLGRLAERGRLDAAAARAAAARLEAVELGALAECELVIEAAPEDLALKQEVCARLSRDVVNARCVLATNTSSLAVGAVAAEAAAPERVVGMHFFNPAPVMPLVEIVASEVTAPWAVAVARATAQAMGKRPVHARDVPGFLANRCQQPFFLEALRVVEEGIAGVDQVDRICRAAAGVPMGPFELMDFIGVDLIAEALPRLYEQSSHEPRWRPPLLLRRMALAGRTGRREPGPVEDAPPLAPPAAGRVEIAGTSRLAGELRELAEARGWTMVAPPAPAGDASPDVCLHVDEATAVSCAARSLARLAPHGRAIGFVLVPPVDAAGVVELIRGERCSDTEMETVDGFFRSLGLRTERIGDAAGGVGGRIVAQLLNEASFAVEQGVATADDVDAAMQLGFGYRTGPIARLEEVGPRWVLDVLDGLRSETGDERYRAAPGLRQRLEAR